MNINITEKDFGTLCICAIRYCHGRRTYMPTEVQRIVGQHLNRIRDNDLKVMLADCDYQRRFNLYGDEIDKEDWLEWEQRLMLEKERRKYDR